MGNFRSEQHRIKKLSVEKFENIVYALKDASDDIIKEIALTYSKYLDGIDTQMFYSEMIKFNRIGKLQDLVREKFGSAYSDDAARVQKALKDMFETTYYRYGYLYNYFSETDLKFKKLNKDLIEYSLRGSSDLWRKLKDEVDNLKMYTPQIDSLSNLLKNNKNSQVIKIKKSINNIFLTGQSFKNARKQLESDLSTYAIERIYRTEATRLYNLSSYNAATSIGVPLEKQWLATFDNAKKHNPPHQDIDGQRVGIDEYFRLGGYKTLLPGQFNVASQDIHCRCTVLYIFEGISPLKRRVKDPETNKYKLFSWNKFEEFKKLYD